MGKCRCSKLHKPFFSVDRIRCRCMFGGFREKYLLVSALKNEMKRYKW